MCVCVCVCVCVSYSKFLSPEGRVHVKGAVLEDQQHTEGTR